MQWLVKAAGREDGSHLVVEAIRRGKIKNILINMGHLILSEAIRSQRAPVDQGNYLLAVMIMTPLFT